MLSKLAIFRYGPLLVLQHVHDYLQCQNRYNMSVLPRMELKNKIANMWIDWPSIGIACRRFESDLGGSTADLGGRTTYDHGGHYSKAQSSHKVSISLSPPSEESSEIRK